MVNSLITLLFLMTLSSTVLLHANAFDVKITYIFPETQTGKVGDTVRVIGAINSTDGLYQIWFGDILVISDTAIGNNVNCSFSVPSLPNGNYTIKLCDVAANVIATSWFCIETNYIIQIGKPPHPEQFQQDSTINISLSLTGGTANTVYAVNITVKTPAEETFWKLIYFSNTKDTGMGNATIKYPDDFTGGAHTSYTGIYTVCLNETLASEKFFIGLTNSAEYHRCDVMSIKAVGYSSLNNANVTVAIRFGNKTVDSFTKKVIDGVVKANWTIPTFMLVGNYSLSITPVPASKKVSDTQVFTVPGFKTDIIPRNLANEPVPSVLVRLYDKCANATYEVTSNDKGAASFWLEKGSYTSTFYFKNAKVSEVLQFDITDAGKKLDWKCWLTNLNITVVSEQNTALKIPFVLLQLAYTYPAELNGNRNKTEKITLQTDITGSVQLHSMLLKAVYTLNASRYGKIFNENNDTFSNLQPLPWNSIAIICPTKSLQVNVVDAVGQPIPGAVVEAREFTGGLSYEGRTDLNGNTILNCILGTYRLKAYSGGLLLNETVVELLEGNKATIRCTLYNLPIYIKVVDYFGQPVSNAQITLERGDFQINSKQTRADGMAIFTEIGGTLTLKVYLAGQNQPVLILTCSILEARNEANPIEVKIENYVMMFGFIVETAQLATIILVIATLALFATLEIARRKRFERKTES